MSVINVSTTAALKAALGAAAAGDTIMLAAGTYSGLQIKSFSGDVTITSADPNNLAKITDMLLSASSGLKFTNLEFDRSAVADSYAYRVESSQNISFSGLNVHGSLDNNPQNDGSGFLIRNSTSVSVTGSELHELSHAIDHANDTYLTFTGNEFHELRSDGIMGNGSAHIVIANNRFHDFHPTATDHPDAIQFWSDAGSRTPEDILITDNVVSQGAGAEIQSIFMSASAGPWFTNLVISGNELIGGLGNGIAINGGQNVTISNNIVGTLASKSIIRLMNADAVDVIENKASAFLYSSVTHLTESGNVDIDAGGGGAVTVTNSDTLVGTVGADTLDGGAGVDSLSGGSGNDVLIGGAGNDIMDGGTGTDTASYSQAAESVNVDLAIKVFQNTGAGGGDTLINMENVVGGAFRDLLRGDAGANDLSGGGGNDTIAGRSGADVLHGGAGGDYFVYYGVSDSRGASRDTITDFSAAEGDLIDLRGIDAKTSTVGNNAFSLVSKFTKVAGQLVVTTDVDHLVVSGDVNGDGVADFAINVYGPSSLKAGSFLL